MDCIAINITKFQTWTLHYYASFYKKPSYLSLNDIQKGIISLNPSIFESLEKSEFGDKFSPIKSTMVKQLLNESLNKILKNCGKKNDLSLIAFYEGRYSKSMTEDLQKAWDKLVKSK